jgi:hypothetical protein
MFSAVSPKYQLIVLLIIGTGVLCWPAFFNGLPLLYPDSMSYIGDGINVAKAFFLRETWGGIIMVIAHLSMGWESYRFI